MNFEDYMEKFESLTMERMTLVKQYNDSHDEALIDKINGYDEQLEILKKLIHDEDAI